MATIQASIRSAIAQLSSSDSPRVDAELLLAAALEKDRTYLFTWPDKNLTDAQQSYFQQLLQRREAGEPISYILERQPFWSLNLRVNPSTLIPRPETELLVETALEKITLDNAQVLDLGTGTGAIALALATERPQWQVTAVDSQQAAVLLAIDNCRQLGLTNVQISKSHWFENVMNQRFDAIVSNPPYIDSQDVHLTQGDVRFEPRSALVSDEQGLADIRHIIEEAPNYLTPNGWLMFEHGCNQAAQAQQLLEQRGFVHVVTLQDLNHQDRVTLGQFC